MSPANSELVSILVPREYVLQIYHFVATLNGAPPQVTEPPAPAWSPDLLRRQFDESPNIIKRFQKILANRPGQRFLTSDMASQLKAAKGSKTIAGALGAFGRRSKNRYKMEDWPFQHEWNHAEGQQSYWMEADVAAIIKDR